MHVVEETAREDQNVSTEDEHGGGGGDFSFVTFPLHFFFLKMSGKSPLQILYNWCNNN